MSKRKLLKFLLLYPLSVMYGWGVGLRNFLFDKQIMLRQTQLDIPVVVVGNLTMGGAGKTPHTEYLISRLKSEYRIGMLSRGYKRHTHGFVLATSNSRPQDIGDEPYQMYRKFSADGVMVAVCEDRVKGIEMMREIDPRLNLIILDDAFQHRYIKPTVSIVLTEHRRPAYADSLLPFGTLREPVKSLDRADVVIVTKCSETIKPVDIRIIKENLKLFPYQKLLFSRYGYLPLQPVFDGAATHVPQLGHMGPTDSILAIAGVANPRPFLSYLRRFGAKLRIITYDDHHGFTQNDMAEILARFNSMKNTSKILITTEKDAVRMASNPYFPAKLRPYAFYLPVTVNFLPTGDPPLESIVKQLIQAR